MADMKDPHVQRALKCMGIKGDVAFHASRAAGTTRRELANELEKEGGGVPQAPTQPSGQVSKSRKQPG